MEKTGALCKRINSPPKLLRPGGEECTPWLWTAWLQVLTLALTSLSKFLKSLCLYFLVYEVRIKWIDKCKILRTVLGTQMVKKHQFLLLLSFWLFFKMMPSLTHHKRNLSLNKTKTPWWYTVVYISNICNNYCSIVPVRKRLELS